MLYLSVCTCLRSHPYELLLHAQTMSLRCHKFTVHRVSPLLPTRNSTTFQNPDRFLQDSLVAQQCLIYKQQLPTRLHAVSTQSVTVQSIAEHSSHFQDFLRNFRKKSTIFQEEWEPWVEESGDRSVIWKTSAFLTKSRH